MNIRPIRSTLALAAVLSTAACVDLDVTNPNNPDVDRALNSPAAMTLLSSSSVNQWYLSAIAVEGTMMMQVTADAATANYGNFGMRFNNEEPRIPYANNSASGDEAAARLMYQGFYRALSAANDVILARANGLDFGSTTENERVVSAAMFTQAATLTGLALQYDQGFPITSPPTASAVPTLQPYTVMRDSALASWDRLIALTADKSWSWDAEWFPLFDHPAMSASILRRVARTMAARTLVLSARTGAQNTATNWSRVLAYADSGITGNGLTDFDISVKDDGGIQWYDYVKLYGSLDSWTRVDQRLINRMVPDVPAKFNGTNPSNINSTRLDLRVADAAAASGTQSCSASNSNTASCIGGNTADEDYINVRTVIGDPGRGIWMQSTFWHKRYRLSSFAFPGATRTGRELMYVLAAENDLMIAEALARTGGDLTRAAALVNKTRVTRGGLAPVAANAADILAAIDYERDVELLNTSAIVTFADARRFERLQTGTMRHMPIPARELEILGVPIYTFGGATANPTGM